MHHAGAAGIAHVADDRTFGKRRPTGLHAGRGALEVPEEHCIIPETPTFAQGVAGDDGVTEQLADEEDFRVALLMLQLHDLHGSPARRCKVEPPVTHVRELAAAALIALRPVEVVAAHRELAVGNRNRVAVDVVSGGAIGATWYLVVRFEAAALVVVGSRNRLELVAAEGRPRRERYANVVVGQSEGGTERGRPLWTPLRWRSIPRVQRSRSIARGAAAQENETDSHRRRSIQRVHTDVEYDTSSVMGLSQRSAIESALDELFQAEQKARDLTDQIADGPAEIVLPVLLETIERARKLPEEQERIARLESVAKILGEVGGPSAVDALIDILGSEEPEARHAAGVVLEDMGFERFKEVALGVERALGTLPPDHLALSELPYILIEVPEPGVVKLIHRFLEHPNEEVAAAAIEACVELGDPTSVAKLARLERDTRLVELEDESASEQATDASVTIGELAKEARLLLQSLEPEDRA
jgi:hypothetical protein